MPLTMSFPVAQLLKKETAQVHAQTEKILAPQLASIRSREDYASILRMFYGFFHPLEIKAGHLVSEDILPDIHERRSADLIISDLKALHLPTEHLPTCNELPEMSSPVEALGVMYVMEGSTLGGRMISKMLMKNSLVRFDESNLHFFNGYKENTGSKWTLLLSVIDRYGEDADRLVATASETFACLTKWMEKSL